jgi:hypothetical protein
MRVQVVYVLFVAPDHAGERVNANPTAMFGRVYAKERLGVYGDDEHCKALAQLQVAAAI